jgi:hypothetical protein
VVEVMMADKQVAYGFERDASIRESSEHYGTVGGIDQHRLITWERHGQAGLGPLRVQRVTSPKKGYPSHRAYLPHRGAHPLLANEWELLLSSVIHPLRITQDAAGCE